MRPAAGYDPQPVLSTLDSHNLYTPQIHLNFPTSSLFPICLLSLDFPTKIPYKFLYSVCLLSVTNKLLEIVIIKGKVGKCSSRDHSMKWTHWAADNAGQDQNFIHREHYYSGQRHPRLCTARRYDTSSRFQSSLTNGFQSLFTGTRQL